MNDAGVVDPIRVPLSVERFVRGMPRIAQLFVGIALIDVVGRWLGVVEPRLFVSTDYPTSFVSAFLPREALILIPAAITLRRPDAETATPWILRGAIAVALVELLGSSTRAFVSEVVTPGETTLLLWFAAVGVVITAVGWVAIGYGLSRLNPPAPAAPVAGLANLAALLVAATFILSLIGFAATNGSSSAANGFFGINTGAQWFGILAWAYLLRSVLRGLDDPSRSLTVTRVAAVGALLSAAMTFSIALLGTIFAFDIQFAIQVGNDPGLWATLAGDSLGISLIVLAIALGLADPLRPMPKDWAAVSASPA